VLADIAALVLVYRYGAIFLIALFEAPVMSLIVGFFAMTGHLNLYLAFGGIVLGDFIGDSVLYLIGRHYRRAFRRIVLRLSLSPARARKVLDYLGTRDRRAIVLSKLVHGVGFTGLIAAGGARVPFRRFITTCITVTVCQSAVLVAIGMLSGRAYGLVAHFLGYFDAVVAAVFLLALFLLYRKLIGTISDRKATDESDT
jgi:membrane protein DedA with SNARE-associated domain